MKRRWYILSRFAKYNAFWLKGPEKLLPRQKDKNCPAPIFIVGAPRSGSTVFYQSFSNYFKVLYVNNLCDIFFRNMELGFAISQKLYGNEPHNCFRSYFGNTFECGLNAPSESGRFWYRWFPRESHYVPAAKAPHGLPDVIKRISLRYGQNLLVKNLTMSMRLQAIHRLWPDARVIWIQREWLPTALSIVQARKKLNGNLQEWWSVKPANFIELLQRPWAEQVVCQVLEIDRQIERDLALFKHSAQIGFEDFRSTPKEVLEKLNSQLNMDLRQRKNAAMAELKTGKNPEKSLYTEKLEEAYQNVIHLYENS